MGIFKTWGEIYDLKKETTVYNSRDLVNYFNGNPDNKILLYAIANNDFKISDNEQNFQDFSKFDKKQGELDFIDNSHPNLFLYIRSNPYPMVKWTTLVFVKNKFYPFPMSLEWYDELGNTINEQTNMWYDPLLFVLSTDLLKAQRLLKLKKLR